MTTPLVTVCVIARNEERHLTAVLDAVRRQSHARIEVLVFDNASTDRTAEICREALSDPRFRHHRNGADIGLVQNINRAYATATGDYVCFLSGNDLIEETYLEALVAILERDPSAVLAAARADWIDDDSQPAQTTWKVRYFETDAADPVGAALTVINQFNSASYFFSLYRRAALERMQPFRHAYAGDMIFVAEAALYGAVRLSPEVLFHRRVHARQGIWHHARNFSLDVTRGVDPAGVLSRLDMVTPHVDLMAGLIDMASLAGIEAAAKEALIQRIPAAVRARYAPRIVNQIQHFKQTLRDSPYLWIEGPVPTTVTLARARAVNRLAWATMAMPEDHELRLLARRLGANL